MKVKTMHSHSSPEIGRFLDLFVTRFSRHFCCLKMKIHRPNICPKQHHQEPYIHNLVLLSFLHHVMAPLAVLGLIEGKEMLIRKRNLCDGGRTLQNA